ncbi:MAG: hypothetical protein HY900_37330 [Deltaproteobacteria bacterium]|nr:hypothetical protein [Deltaproteobacteria bacterium]
MTPGDWSNSFARCLGVLLRGDALEETNERGDPILDHTFVILMNAHWEPLEFRAPKPGQEGVWRLVLDTRYPAGAPSFVRMLQSGEPFRLEARSLCVFRLVQPKEPAEENLLSLGLSEELCRQYGSPELCSPAAQAREEAAAAEGSAES